MSLPSYLFAESELPWVYINARPMLSQQHLADKLGVQVFFDSQRRRILVAGQDKNAFFLPWGTYAVIEGKFLRLAKPVIEVKGKFYFDAALIQAHLLPFIPEKKRDLLKEEIRQSYAKLEYSGCALERPVHKVFLDPGHGGEDQGAVRLALEEKNIVLNFAKQVEAELQRRGFSTLLSRNRDEFLPLDLRPQLAQEWGADIFVSIHANTSQFPGARGTETYILSSDATDAEARKLAISENAYLREKGKGNNAEQTLENILWDMGQMAYLQDSAHLAANIQTSVFQESNQYFTQVKAHERWRNRGVREAPFVVLSRAAMPAVLVELAYLSNAQDRTVLKSKDFQSILAKSIVDGIAKFAKHCEPKQN